MAVIFDRMYQNFINYREEYIFYSSLCKKYNAKKILEIMTTHFKVLGEYKQGKQ